MGIPLENVAGEVVEALRRDGIESIVLGGPAVARWLYGSPEMRPYGDVDLLVAPTAVDACSPVLGRLGFRREHGEQPPALPQTWSRKHDHAFVQIHHALDGVAAQPEAQWRILSRHAVELVVDGRTIPVLRSPARELALVLAAATKGAYAETTMRDLHLALTDTAVQTWRDASVLAEQLGADATFATGLRLTDTGASVASQLGLATNVPPDIILRATARPDVREPALGLERLRRAPGWRERAALVGSALSPQQVAAYTRFPWVNTPLAYGSNILCLTRHAVPAFLAWRSATRRAEHPHET